MRLTVLHKTHYTYDAPVPYGLQQIRLRPKSRPGQLVEDWQIDVSGGQVEVSFEDEHANAVDLVSFASGHKEIEITCSGTVEVEDKAGVVGPQGGYVPLWLFRRSTSLTKPGDRIKTLIADAPTEGGDLDRLHALSAHVLDAVPYSTDQAASDLTAETVMEAGHGVCQDHAHVFITAARALGYPARYVSGYLMMNDRVDQDASHAWAEAHVNGLGWVGFDISNGISPDARYVRVATGLDYRDAAPISGLRYGNAAEDMSVTLQVQQQ
ncbi:transglutaminase family protein [Tateyamaria omphalii]|uniref:transglutaminase family protein n=1 Tax=Tateyamaria omphalii TaxID=299262 RepID=UPI001C995037|nr:transglutaminase family protein [Tateyamaria omphalii]MBY5931799.1 transglutaminase family protein [Tateyamaria omphalii]